MPSRYAQWMYDWEHRLTSVDNNRVVRPLEWGVEWARDWPCGNGVNGRGPRGNGAVGHSEIAGEGARATPAHATLADDPAEFFLDFNRRIVADSDRFYSYTRPADFRLERREVQVFSTREVPDP